MTKKRKGTNELLSGCKRGSTQINKLTDPDNDNITNKLAPIYAACTKKLTPSFH